MCHWSAPWFTVYSVAWIAPARMVPPGSAEAGDRAVRELAVAGHSVWQLGIAVLPG